jgi:hypothetical protein
MFYYWCPVTLTKSKSMAPPQTRRFLLAIESDATRYHGASASRPKLLNSSDCDQLMAHIATDLAALLPQSAHCKLVAAGALFDQTQVLRPAYPVFAALQELLMESGSPAQPGSICLGADQDRIPRQGLQPEPDIPLGLLQLLPILVSGSNEVIDELGTAMEHRFLEEGQVSAHTARWLENAFAIKINHARFMTLMDLNAMFRLQLEHFGFMPLWKILDAALNDQAEGFEVSLENGQVYRWRGQKVHTEYQSFDYWSNQGGGQELDSGRGKLAGAYADWTRMTRQFLTVLRAHAVPLVFHLPGQPQQPLTDSFFVEAGSNEIRTGRAEITEHSFAELGTICVTVIQDGQQSNYYPLSSQGLNDIHQAIRDSGPSGRTVAFPGSILFDENNRSLVAEPVSGRMRH